MYRSQSYRSNLPNNFEPRRGTGYPRHLEKQHGDKSLCGSEMVVELQQCDQPKCLPTPIFFWYIGILEKRPVVASDGDS